MGDPQNEIIFFRPLVKFICGICSQIGKSTSMMIQDDSRAAKSTVFARLCRTPVQLYPAQLTDLQKETWSLVSRGRC